MPANLRFMASNDPYALYSIISTIVIILAITLARIYRIYKVRHGTRINARRTTFFIVVYLVFACTVAARSFFIGVPVVYDIPYAVLLISGGYFSYRFSQKRVSFWKDRNGSIYSKGGIIIYLVAMAALVLRIMIDFAFLSRAPVFFGPNEVVTNTDQLTIFAFMITDLLLMFGIGLIIGRNASILKSCMLIRQGKESITITPLGVANDHVS